MHARGDGSGLLQCLPMNAPETPPKRRFRKRWIAWAALAGWAALGVWTTVKPMPPGTNVSTQAVAAAATDIRFLTDLTYADGQGKIVHEQQIFDAVLGIIDHAESFIIADFFLLNDFMGADGSVYRQLSRQLVDHLIARKQEQPRLAVLLVTDPINEVYGGMQSELLAELKTAGIDVVLTELEALRDSNPGYSSVWRLVGQWWGNSLQGGSRPNPFDTEARPITLRSWLALLNFKANHRKLVVADRSDGSVAGLVTSANPHDASSAHSNVALSFTGSTALKIAESEQAIARFSGWTATIFASSPELAPESPPQTSVQISFVTEQAIREHLLSSIDAARNGDSVRMAMFYLSDRKIIAALLAAAERGVDLKLILDPNKDAFGRTKDGVPNRPVANELVSQSEGRIQVRWYRTHGEQFHTKLTLITSGDRVIASLGSANLTRRNLGNYNLEANIALAMPGDSTLARDMLGFFDRLWNNEGAPDTEFTAPFGAYADTDRGRYWRYRLMEATGIGTF